MRIHYKLLAVLIILYLILIISTSPSNDRDWSDDHSRTSDVIIDDNLVTITNIRNFTYKNTGEHTISYYNRTYDTEKIRKAYFVIEPFGGLPGAAHTLITFEFDNDTFISLSVEARREKGEEYSLIKGLFRQYELIYVWGDERDIINLRANYRNNKVILYPINATDEDVKKVFLRLAQRTKELSEKPEFYNLITNSCTTNLIREVNSLFPGTIKWSWRWYLPRATDVLLYKEKLIETNLSLDKAREAFTINERARKYINSTNFSLLIREAQE